MAAELEEVVVNAERRGAEDLGPDLGELRFERRSRRDTSVLGAARRIGLRQRRAIDFAVHRQRQLLEHDERRRDFVLRQAFFQIRAERRFKFMGVGADPSTLVLSRVEGRALRAGMRVRLYDQAIETGSGHVGDEARIA